MGRSRFFDSPVNRQLATENQLTPRINVRYWHFINNEPIAARLLFIQFIAFFGAWFTNVAIYTLLLQLGASPFLLSLAAALHLIPAIIQAPFSGPLIDKLNPKGLMTVLLTIQIVTTLLMLMVDSLDMVWFLFLLLFIRMGASSFYFTVKMALLPKLLQGKGLQTANELQSMCWSFTYTAGMALSGIVVYLWGTDIAFILDAALFLIAISLFLMIPLPKNKRISKDSIWTMIREGVLYLKGHPQAVHIMILHASVGLTAYESLIAILADIAYREVLAIPLAIGFLNAVRALALMLGPALLGKWMNDKRLLYLLIFQGFAIIFWGFILENFYISLIGSFAAGFVSSIIWSYTYTMLQKQVEEQFYGRVIAYNDMLFMASGATVSLLIGQLIEHGWQAQTILIMLGSGFLLYTVYYYWVYKTILTKEKR